MDTPTSLSLPTPATPIDLSQSFALDTKANGKNDAAQAATLAQEFEAMLLLQMVRGMRQSLLTDDEQGEGLGQETMTDTFDAEFARYLAQKGGLGLQDFIKTQVTKNSNAGSAGADSTKAAGTQIQPNTAIPAHTAVPATPIRHSDSPAGPVTANSAAAASVDAAGTKIAASGGAGIDASARGVDDSEEGELTRPLDGAATTSKFGWRPDPFHGRRRFHSGVDLKAAYGTEVPAAGHGRVTFSGERGGYGTLVVIQHEDGVETRYAHLAATEVREGDRVESGQTIGRVGSSGRSTGAHLHFEVLVNGTRVDPERLVSRNTGEFKSVRSLVD
jgi:murein DD-endopeptidase MepM/ murein hydrolase activator NlpD